jgi:protoporphyrin/coproporphyrin ferrochelatase
MNKTPQKHILVQLGTPDQSTPKSVGIYLKEFLMDPLVIPLPWLLRWFLVHCIIVPFRSKDSAKRYQSIWDMDTNKSPLLLETELLVDNLQKTFPDLQVCIGMRYGQTHRFENVLKQSHKDTTALHIVPLFPQYSTAIQGSIFQYLWNFLSAKHINQTAIQTTSSFYNESFYQESLGEWVLQHKPNNTEAIVVSYHGLPIKQLVKADIENSGLYCCGGSTKPKISQMQCCQIKTHNTNCYGFQCQQTTTNLEKYLHRFQDHTPVYHAYQSRLRGTGKWLEPTLDQIFATLKTQNIQHITVVVPSFIVDCIESLEEIGIEYRSIWLKQGGKSLTLVPGLSQSQTFVNRFGEWLLANS